MPVALRLLSGLLSLLLMLTAAAAGGQTGSPATAEGQEVIRALGDARDIRAAARLAEDGLERIYYVAAEGGADVFCVLARRNGGDWAREAEAVELLPRGMAETPRIAFENDRRVYITYYPDDVVSTSIFLFGLTLAREGGRWYVEAVSFGSPDAEKGIFKALVVNLAMKTTSEYAFDVESEELVSSRESPNKLNPLRADGFSLDDFRSSIGIKP